MTGDDITAGGVLLLRNRTLPSPRRGGRRTLRRPELPPNERKRGTGERFSNRRILVAAPLGKKVKTL